MDFPYLARVTRLNVTSLVALASAPMPPAPSVDAAVKTWTDLTWEAVLGATGYSIWKRRTDASTWEAEPVIANVATTSARLDGVRGDDWLFGVSSTGIGGARSPIASAVPGGVFAPLDRTGN
jgi:hypothetical protein